MKFVNIYTGEQKDPTYMAVNPSAMVPTVGGHGLWTPPRPPLSVRVLQVPSLMIDGHVSGGSIEGEGGGSLCVCVCVQALRQSTAIIEYLEDTRPSAPKLLPNDPHKRAAVSRHISRSHTHTHTPQCLSVCAVQVREIAEIVACDIQPIQNLRVSAMVADFCQKYQPTITGEHSVTHSTKTHRQPAPLSLSLALSVCVCVCVRR